MIDSPRNDDAASAVQDATYRESLDFLYNRINYERLAAGTSRYPFRLTRMRELLGRLGLRHFLCPLGQLSDHSRNDQDRPNQPMLVHIAGTKGKGSTAAMVAASLSGAGFKTGLYTSPHLHRLEERFRIDAELCSPDQLIDLVNRIRPVDEGLIKDKAGSASFFELTTALALLHFHLAKCDAIVLETGLGGRLDSTNVCQPDVTAITSIGLDHQHVLGNTIAEIAAEKAGIIKPGVPIVSGVLVGEAADVIERIAAERDAPLYKLGRDFRVTWQPAAEWGSHVLFEGITKPLTDRLETDLPLDGEHQSRNAAVAIAIVQLLRDRIGVNVNDSAIAAALATIHCEGRIERYALPDDVRIIIDAAHNEDSIRALCECLRRRAGAGPVAIVFGTSVDKAAVPMLELIATLRTEIDLTMIQITRFHGNPRWRSPTELMELMPSEIAPIASIEEDAIGACQRAINHVTPGGTVVVCGSFFLAAETRPWVSTLRT